MVQLIKDYGKPIEWNIGSLFAHDRYAWGLIDILNELGYENPIKYVFGSIPCLFQGGRVPPRDAELNDALKIMDNYNDRGVGCRLTYSNVFIEESDLDDEICNKMLSHLNNRGGVGNGVIVSSDILAKYIKGKYPNLQIIASQVKPSVETGLGSDKDTVDYYNKLFDIYDIIVVNPFKVQDGEFLNKLVHHDRVEFIANHRCTPDCPIAKLHYETQMQFGMKALKQEDYSKELELLDKINEECLKVKATYPLAGTSLSQSDIEGLVRLGFNQFKLEGRDNDGICFIRDLGDYIFVSYLYQRLANALMQEAV